MQRAIFSEYVFILLKNLEAFPPKHSYWSELPTKTVQLHVEPIRRKIVTFLQEK